MTVEELIDAGVCQDMDEALCMFPLECFEDWAAASNLARVGGVRITPEVQPPDSDGAQD
jgi:hypothetical protein